MRKSKYVILIFLVLLVMLTGCLKQETRIEDLPNHLVESSAKAEARDPITTSNQPLSILATGDHSFMVDNLGDLWVWGETGSNHSNLQLKHKKVSGISNVSLVAGSRIYTLVLKQDGSVWGWGNNRDGQLGDGTYISRERPVQTIGLEDIQAIDAHVTSAIALKKDGTVWTWGDNMYGQLGVDRKNGEIPAQVPGLQDIVAVAASDLGSLALQEDGTVWAWGYGPQLDLNVEGVGQDIPAKVEGINDVVDISARGGDILALKKDGTVWNWGGGGPPIIVEELTNISAIKQGTTCSYAIDQDGAVWTWTGDEKPKKVPGLADITTISGGVEYTIAVDADGNLWSWGDNTYGQLGDGTTVSRDTPVKISLEEGTPIENDYTDHDVFTVKYDNTEINFSIEFPPSWKGKYLVKQEDESVVIYHNTTFEDPTWIIDISTTSSEMWREHPPGEYPWDKLGEKDGVVIVYHQLVEQAYPLKYRDEEDEVTSMLYDIKQVKINIMD